MSIVLWQKNNWTLVKSFVGLLAKKHSITRRNKKVLHKTDYHGKHCTFYYVVIMLCSLFTCFSNFSSMTTSDFRRHTNIRINSSCFDWQTWLRKTFELCMEKNQQNPTIKTYTTTHKTSSNILSHYINAKHTNYSLVSLKYLKKLYWYAP